jgi:filamentous hemagglutinin
VPFVATEDGLMQRVGGGSQGADALGGRGLGLADAGRGAAPWKSKYWSESEFRGNKVYQRNDLIDPTKLDAMGRTNLQRMEKGLAPLGPDSKPINLHHVLQTETGPVAELTQTFHQQNKGIVHINPSAIPSGIDRTAFNAWKAEYWKSRAQDFAPK